MLSILQEKTFKSDKIVVLPKIISLKIKFAMILRFKIMLSIVFHERKNTFHDKNLKLTKKDTFNKVA